ncbi:helix-turn-helix domain-containing protein [Verrucomicrobium sp. GAS474]|uniref:AraC family transcriptional regulator n=1 Tax=Verrucomicrobium sp. GAS474 TaxID=1882831 RepID=UPI0012FF68F7|nr:helix-turn-helix domain-containing protein [Verrucomicrobium sp. GAS474]
MPLPVRTDPLENWNDLRVQLAWAYSGPTAYPRTTLPTSLVSSWLLSRGEVTLIYGAERKTYGPGAWIFPREGEGRHDFSDDASLLSVRFGAHWPTGEALFDRSRTICFPAGEAPRLARLGERLARFVSRTFPGTTLDLVRVSSPSPERYFEMQRLLYGWVLEYTLAMKRQGLRPNTIGQLDDRVRRAVHLMENQPLSLPLRERDLSHALGISTGQLNRLFLRDLGTTPADYWERKRSQAAHLAITESNRSMKSIAYDLGFGSLSHFSSWVRKKLGKSPRQLRKEME